MPPALLLPAVIIYNLINPEGFESFANKANSYLLEIFSYGFVYVSFLAFIIIILSLISPKLSRVRIGGDNAKPEFSKLKYFSIVLCTTVATGILFWGAAEPIYHISTPPLGIKQNSNDAKIFALEAVFLHWTFIPYAIYTLIALMFAIGYYNKTGDLTLRSSLFPFEILRKSKSVGIAIDNLSLFALLLGMSASLGAGILTLSGGIRSILGIEESSILLIVIALIIILAFILSAISGIHGGISLFSNINFYIFLIFAFLVFLFSNPIEIMNTSFDSLSSFASNFFRDSLHIIDKSPDWAQGWTVFNWANWMAWAPITGIFLGRIAYGLTVSQLIIFNWLLPSLFGIVWMSVFSGASLNLHFSGNIDLINSLNNSGPESIIYLILNELPLASLLIFLFLLAVFLSYVTAADSNLEAISSITQKSDSNSKGIILKIFWGLLIGIVSLIMINTIGINGIKILSNLGGLPVLILMVFLILGLIKELIKKPTKSRPRN